MKRLSTALAVLSLAAAARAGDDASLARLLPPDVPVYLEARAPTAEELRGQAAYQCFADPLFQKFLERTQGSINGFDRMQVPLGEGALKLKTDMFGSGVSMDIMYADAEGESAFKIRNHFAVAWIGLAEGTVPVDLVVALEVAGDPAEALAVLRRIVAAAAVQLRREAGQPAGGFDPIFTEERHGGVMCTVIRISDVEVYAAPLGKFVVATTTRARLADMIERHGGGGGPSLATAPMHEAALARVPGDGTVTTLLTIRTDLILDVVGQIEPANAMMARSWMKQLGLDGLQGLSVIARVDGAGVTSTSSVLLDGPRKGLARLFEGSAPADLAGLAFAPKDSFYASCGRLDLGGLYQIGLEVGGMPFAMLGGQFEREFQLRLKEDLLDYVGPDATFIIAPSRGVLPDVALVLGSKDAAKLEATLMQLAERLPGRDEFGLETTDLGDGVRLHSFSMSQPAFGGVPVAPSFGVVDGKLLVTPFPLTFTRMLAVQRGEIPNLAANRDFASLRERVPEGAMAVSYLDLARVAALVYDTAVPFLQSMPDASGQRAALAALPDSRFLEKYLYGRIAWRIADEQGMHWVSHASIDTSGAALGMLGGAIGAAGMFLVTGVEEAAPPPVQIQPVDPEAGTDRAAEARQCRTRVRLIRARLRLHNKQNGAYPDTLDALRARHVPPETFEVPGADKKAYVYLGADGKKKVLLHGYPNGADGLVTVLTTDLELRRVTEEALKAQLRQ